MKINEIRQLTDEELAAELERVRKHLFDVRSQAVTEKLEDPSMVIKARRDIARIVTVQRQREIAARQAVEDES